MSTRKIVIIGGGVGPMAGVKLHEHIIAGTKTNGTDQDHLEVVHLSRSPDIMDRTEALRANCPEVPAQGMLRTFQMAAAAIAGSGLEAVGGIPCNTFHSPSIFGRFATLLKEANSPIKIINMLDALVGAVTFQLPKVRKLGVMSSTGTRMTGLYTELLSSYGIECLQVRETMQDELHDSIYNLEWGIKAITPVSPQARGNFVRYVEILAEMGAEAIILGCTEIPLALPEKQLNGLLLLDPMVSLAEALVADAMQN